MTEATAPFGVPEVIVLLAALPIRRRKFWQRVFHGALVDLEHGQLNGVSVIAVFDHQPTEAIVKECLEKAGASFWMLIRSPLSDARHVYLDKFGRERDVVEMELP